MKSKCGFEIKICCCYGAKRLEAPPEVRKAILEYETKVVEELTKLIEAMGGFRA